MTRPKSKPQSFTTPTTATAEASTRLLGAHSSGHPCAPVRDLIGDDIVAAYTVQNTLTEKWLAEGRRIVGRKIGLTNRAGQQRVGADTPDVGMLFADMAVPDGEEIPPGTVLQPMVEAEVAIVLEHDLVHERHTVADLIAATAFALPAIEVAGSRIKDWDITLADTVVDNASSGRYVLGTRPVSLHDVDLRAVTMTLDRRGEQVATGTGANCLGHPLNALLWLADTAVRSSRPLKAGDTVITGTLGQVVPAEPGDMLEATIEGLGDVRVAFGKA